MSESGEGTENLNKEGETPTAPVSEGIPITSPKDEVDSCSLKDVDSNPPPPTKADSLEDPSLIEALIEKKLPSDKEKGLDVDSELDFELKWDDDPDLNENQGIDDIDLDAGKKIEGHVTIEKDVEKEADSALTSTEQDLDSLGKTGNSFSSTEKDLDSLDNDTSTSIDKDLDKETEVILSSIDEHLDAAGEEIQTVSEEKDIDNIDSLIDDKNENKDHNIDADINIKAMDVAVNEASQVKDIGNEPNIVPKRSSDSLLNTEVTSEKTKTFNIDTNVRIDTEIKTSPIASEANSLDEELVYSPDVEDKDLIDEIDATDISNEKFEHTEQAISSDLITDKVEAETAEKLSSDGIISHKEGESTEKDETKMDVDVDLEKSQTTEKSANDTISSTTDMNTSTYDINNEHGLDRPDVMIDIPTQELIDTFDDADETFDNNDNEDQSVSNIIDKLDFESSKDTENLTETKTTEDINMEKPTPDEILEDKLLRDEVETSNNELANDIAQVESMEVDTNDCFKEPEIKSDDATKIAQVEDTNIPDLETKKLEENMDVEEKVTHADILLEANSEQQKAEESSTPAETLGNVEDSEDIVLEANSEQQEPHNTAPLQIVANVKGGEDIVLEANSEQQEAQDTAPTEIVANVEGSEDIVLEASSEQQAQDSISSQIVANVKASEDVVLEASSEQQAQDTAPTEIVANVKAGEDIVLDAKSEQQKSQSTTPAESVANVEGKDDIVLEAKSEKKSQDNTPAETVANVEGKEDIVLEARSEEKSQDITTAETVANVEANVESADNLELKEATVPKTVDEAQPSTSKYHQESSDEDQEATDSLGLLAESSRVMDDDDEQEQEPEPEDDDDDDDFDQDDESNQMTAEHSEDSNAQQSEAEVPKEPMDVDESNDAPEAIPEETDIQTDMSEMEESHDGLPDTAEADVLPDETEAQSDDINDDEQSSDEKDDLDIQIGAVMSQNEIAAVVAPENIEATETQKAVDALLEDEKTKESEDEPPVAVRIDEKEVEPTDSVATSKLRQLLLKDESSANTPEEKKSPSKTKKLEIAKPKNEINIVELEESSSEDDIQVINKESLAPGSPKDVTSVTIPSGVEVMAAAAGETSDIQEKDGAVKVSGLPKPQPQKPARLNTDEISIKTASAAEPFVVPETKAVQKTSESKAPIDFGLEIFSLDSDDEETEVRKLNYVCMGTRASWRLLRRHGIGQDGEQYNIEPLMVVTIFRHEDSTLKKITNVTFSQVKGKRKSKLTAVELDKARQTNKCINMNCTSDGSVPLVPASLSAAVYYAANQQRGGGLCLYCAKRFEERSEKLVEGVKDLTPYLSMDMCMIREELVEISDSDSEDEPDIVKHDDEIIGEKGAKFLEEQLAAMFNDTWKKFNMEERLLSAQAEINVEVGQLEEECKEIDALLNECQKETDKLRNDLYATFADDRTELPSIAIVDTPTTQWSGLEEAVEIPPPPPEVRERPKRRSASAVEPPAKRAAIPLGYEPIDRDAGTSKQGEPKPAPTADLTAQNDDDNSDISVVKLSVEAAPLGLPPPGVATRAPLRPNMWVYAMRNTFGAWHKVKIQEVQPKAAGQFTMCRVRFEQPKTIQKLLPARCLAYEQPPDVRLTIGTRVVALFKDHRVEKKEEGEKKEAYYSGIVAEIPNPVNSFRYLIFFDDGYAQYVQHANTRLVCECAPRVWDEVHPFSRNFVRDYLRAYPERPMVRLHAGQSIKTEWDGKWWVSKVLQVDASLVLVYFEGKKDNKTEWIYRGSTRLAPLYLELQAAERTRARPLPRAQAARRFNMPYVEYTRSDETEKSATMAPAATPQQTPAQIHASMEQEIRRQRAVAKKSTALPPAAAAPAAAPAVARDNVTSRVVFYTPKNAIKPHKMVPHTCGPRCKRTDVLALKDLRTYNPLTKPLLSGWERQTVRYRIPAVKAVMYRAPCGRRIRNYEELHKYLQCIDSDMGVDLFDFNPATHCLAEFLLNKCLISKKDLSHGKENVPVPCVNYYDSSLPEFCSYNTERTPTAGVPLNIDPEFLCGCDCTDDCADKSKCACWKMTLEGARTIGLDTSEVGYVYKRLPEPLPSGIYECNSRCKCKQTCLNRVAQHPLQLKLQVFKTANRGWGIRALNDVPKGAFLCVYAGNLLTDATANLDGLNEGDEYLAELDYIEVVEQMKEGFEEDIPEDAKKLDEEENDSSSMSSSSDEEPEKPNEDDDFRPTLPTGQYAPSEYSKRLRKREKSKKAKEKEDREKKQRERDGDDCITISDDEELREPAHFSAQAGMGGKEFISKYKSVRTLFGKDEACYIMDAKVQGNIGRYLNHSCTPNVFVQNVFVDTHDPRFPWVAFFALSQIRAGTELTWNYNYDVGSVPGKVLYCYCNAPNCRGRLL